MAVDHSTQLHVAMFPFFAFGHVSPYIQLSNKLSSHGVRISFLTIPGFISRVQDLLIPSPNTRIIPIQIPPSIPGLSPDVAGTADLPPSDAVKLITAIDLTQPQIRTILSDLKPHFVLFDFAQHWLPSLASDLGIKALIFSVFSAIANAYAIVPTRLAGVEGRPVTADDLVKPPPGFPTSSFHGGRLIKTFEARSFAFVYEPVEGSLSNYDRVQEGINGCSAMVLKTCSEMEGPYIDYMKIQFRKPFILTGPLVPEPPSRELDPKWAQWLALFPAKTVVFCSFGSETFLTREQIRELALGLELTGLPFLLVLNFPANVAGGGWAELERSLPEGFLKRVKDRGFVHVGWVPQQLILAHTSIGCYLFHVGFSSVIEALVNDCQLALLPIKSDQFFNSRLVGETGILKAGVEVKLRDEDGYLGKEEILAAVKTVMVDVDVEPGRSIRLNQQKWRKFLLNKNVQDKFISNMVSEMKKMKNGVV
ncbi:UDP-glucuronosyl/UDP-glucosyltransferase [Parasponia andersonii]|uniref:UDP-glucuronosyl/UDP-glucosyltransferase n=1 Tax=Parasponia andersonii TaxID=3476 RepID=A0A2P5AUJ5_PARAD|nr:UDP-glucuronosyl/UDP-glucosyltransferase [Parasponia andersonii]